MKEKYELEFILNSSPRILEKMFSSPDGLGEWFADDVTVKDDIYTFSWDGSSEQARLIHHKLQSCIRFKWLADEEDAV
ncbi:MAG: START-like domain-containing protein, partial [Bacteroidota bacterium]